MSHTGAKAAVKHTTVAFFVPHQGCPNKCVFCNQGAISGCSVPPAPEAVAEVLKQAASRMGERVHTAQIAFFGGSFTAVDAGYRRALLSAAQPFLGERGFAGVRISTRPDCIDEGVLRELADHGVTAVELGAQSMDDGVLSRCGRGHTAADTRRAARLIGQSGLSLGLQMMTGLPGDDADGARRTARELAALEPETVRIYPALVLRGTELERQYRRGEYRPQTLEEAVALCAELLSCFEERGIRVIRLGLHEEEGLEEAVLAGPRHPAFRELCEGDILLQRVLAQLEPGYTGPLTLTVHPASVSKMAGQRRCNRKALEELGLRARIKTDARIRKLDVAVSLPEKRKHNPNHPGHGPDTAKGDRALATSLTGNSGLQVLSRPDQADV